MHEAEENTVKLVSGLTVELFFGLKKKKKITETTEINERIFKRCHIGWFSDSQESKQNFYQYAFLCACNFQHIHLLANIRSFLFSSGSSLEAT